MTSDLNNDTSMVSSEQLVSETHSKAAQPVKQGRVPRWLLPVSVLVIVGLILGGGLWAVSVFREKQAQEQLVFARTECVKTRKQVVKLFDTLKPFNMRVTSMRERLQSLVEQRDKKAEVLVKQFTSLQPVQETMVPDCPVVSGKHKPGMGEYQTVTQALKRLVKKFTEQGKQVTHLLKESQTVLDEYALREARELAEQAKGKVADQATLDMLNKAIERKDVNGLTNLSWKVQESMQTKVESDRQAQEAARQAQARARSQRMYPRYQSYQGAYGQGTTPSQPWTLVDKNGNPEKDQTNRQLTFEEMQAMSKHGDQYDCQPGQGCPIG